ncbi:energy transducer TonB [Hymenobacter sp. 5317J-9]|uniref:TonB family protein n=1 Tax=Hymenobacter sp. 5317J-9 TaxID=2932250 RepID=UPI001FD68210|nr:TonB family protein [Hymenobacter sp. 5317J-9]UOQ98061.1 energy transducer TonB [Hymenobacter sp. 5317J-9]
MLRSFSLPSHPFASLLFLCVVLATATPARAQTTPSTSQATPPEIEKIEGQVYTYVEQMPQLPGGGGNRAIVLAIQGLIKYPRQALAQGIQGRVLVNFTVGKKGVVRDVRIAQGIGGGCDEAVLEAVRQLPRFKPGMQQGKPVAVSFTVPITFRLPSGGAVEAPQVYALVDQMPELPGGGGTAAIARALQQALVLPAELPAAGKPNKVFVGFIVDPSGTVHDIKVVRSLNASCDAAAIAAAEKLPRFVGGKLNGKPVSVSYVAPVVFAAPAAEEAK